MVGAGICEQQRRTWIMCAKVSFRENMRGVFFIGKCEQTSSSFGWGVFGIKPKGCSIYYRLDFGFQFHMEGYRK